MKNKYILTGLIVALSIAFQSCTKDFLELEPKTGQSEANYYKTEGDAFLALTAVYDALSVQNGTGTFIPIMSDIYSDDAFSGGSDAGDMKQWHQIEQSILTADNESAQALWSRLYSGIYRANLYLQKQEGIAWETEGLKTRMEAEAKFLRAYFYWDLERSFGWVPIIKEVLPNVADYSNLPQNTPDEVYTQIATDILAAIPALPTAVPADEAGRVTKYAAEALLARIYLFHEGFAKVVLGASAWTDGAATIDRAYATAALEDIISSGAYHLLTKYSDVFAWENQNNAESLFEWQYSEKSKQGDWNQNGWNYNGNFSVVMYGVRAPEGDPTYNNAGWSLAVPTWSLVNEFEPGDPRLATSIYFADVNLTKYQKGFMNTGYFNKKYMPYTPGFVSGGDPAMNWAKNYIDIRYADVLLMAAELNLGVNNAKTLEYFNLVRERALGSGTGLLNVNIDNIYHERRVELYGEGHRKWDLLRRSLTYAQQKIDASFVLPVGIPNTAEFEGRTYKDGYWGMLPIPASEIRNVNEGMLKQYVPAYL